MFSYGLFPRGVKKVSLCGNGLKKMFFVNVGQKGENVVNFLLFKSLFYNLKDWFIDWIMFYAAFNSISVIIRRHLTLFMSFLGFTSSRLGLWSVLPKDYESNTLPLSHAWPPILKIDFMVFNTIFNNNCIFIQSTHLWYYPGVLLASTLHIILSEPLAAFPHNHCWNNGQHWEKNESCRNGYHQFLETILAKPGIKPASNLLFSSPVCYCLALSYGAKWLNLLKKQITLTT